MSKVKVADFDRFTFFKCEWQIKTGRFLENLNFCFRYIKLICAFHQILKALKTIKFKLIRHVHAFHNFIMSVYVCVCVDANYRKVNQLHVCTYVYFINPATVKA